MTYDTRIAAQRDPSMRGVRFYVWAKTRTGEATAQPVVFTEQPPGQMLESCLDVSYEAAQMLINDLWNAGFRPDNAKATDETVATQKAHIEDLRNVTGRLLDLIAEAAPHA